MAAYPARRALGVQWLLWRVGGAMAFVVALSHGAAFAGAPDVTPLKVLIVTQPGVPLAEVAAREAVAHGGRRDGRKVPVNVEIRHDDRSKTERAFARELRPLLGGFDLVFATELYIARALQIENSRVPIVFDGVADAAALCLVDTLRRPGRNATGYMNVLADEEPKLVETVLQGFPATRRVVFLLSGHNVSPTSCSPQDPAWGDIARACQPGDHHAEPELRPLAKIDAIRSKAAELGVVLTFSVLCDASDVAKLLRKTRNFDSVAFVVPWHQLFVDHAQQLVAALGQTGRPAIYARHQFTALGGVVSMEPTVDRRDDRVSIDLMLKVLDGHSPATLPVHTPRGFSIRVNASAAQAQGLQPSLFLLRRADTITQDTGAR